MQVSGRLPVAQCKSPLPDANVNTEELAYRQKLWVWPGQASKSEDISEEEQEALARCFRSRMWAAAQRTTMAARDIAVVVGVVVALVGGDGLVRVRAPSLGRTEPQPFHLVLGRM